MDEPWNLLIAFAAGVLVGYLLKQSQIAKMKPYVMLTDFTRDESGRVASIVEKLTYQPSASA